MSPLQSQYPGLVVVVGDVGKVCRSLCKGGQCCIVLGLRVWELTPERLKAVSLLLSLLPPPGVYVCTKCGYELFSSRSKYAHSSPWPAFTETIHADSVAKCPEHNRPEALKVGGSSRGRRGGCWPPLPSCCYSHSSRGLESIPGLSGLRQGAWGPGGERETGRLSCTGSGMEVNLS